MYNITCDPHFEENCQSESLETIAAKLEGKPYDIAVQIDIKTSRLHLNVTVMFSNFRALTINGRREYTTVLCTSEFENDAESDNGIMISNIQDKVVINNLILTLCGSNPADVLNQTFETQYCNSLSTLTIFHCNDVELREITIEQSKGVGLMILNHNGGIVNVVSSLFKKNKPPKNNSVVVTKYGGGGVYIELSGCQQFPVTVLFENCTFINNTSGLESQTIDFRYGFLDGNDRNGGGVYIFVKDGSCNIYISFVCCNFTANQAYFGGGMSVNFLNDNDYMINNITLEIEDSVFKHNGCAEDSMHGGGLSLKFSSMDLGGLGSGVPDCHFLLRNITFIENCALIGGGAYYHSYHGKQVSDFNLSSTQFDACSFEGNKAHVGSALAMIPDVFLKTHRGYIVVPTVRNCHFLNNIVFDKQTGIQSIPGIGTVYASLYDITFEGYNIFQNNNGTAMYSVNGILHFQKSNATFVSNTGLHGGAVALIGFSKMVVGQNYSYEFINNSALFLGGAIFVSQTDITDFSVSRSCFIQYANYNISDLHAEWKTDITFTGNKAQNDAAGHAIYATSLNSCKMIEVNTRNSTLLGAFKLRGFTFDVELHDQRQIVTDGSTLSLDTTKSMPLMIIPGENYQHGVGATDDLGQPVETSFRVAINEKETSNVQLDPTFSAIIDDEIQLVGNKGQKATLHLEAVSARLTSVQLNITLLDCPPGFKLNNNTLKCTCNSQDHLGLLRCHEEDFYSYLITGYWVGYIESELVTSVCPFCDYGTSKSEVALPKSCNRSKLDNRVCGKTRTGIACGTCRHNYTVHFHSQHFSCKPIPPGGCKLGWFFYLLTELVPVTLFFFIVLVFNISFTSGGVNGFILFSQLLCSLDIHASGIITFPSDKLRNAIHGYQLFYGIFNLAIDFEFDVLSFCLWKEASALDIIALKYITILYSLILIVVVIWLINKCGGRCLGKFCRISTIKTSVTHGISTFLMISYAQCIKISLNLLHPAHIYTEYNSGGIHPRVWFNGELEYFRGKHLLYAIPALFCLLTFGLLPPVLLLCYPLLNKVLTFLDLENNNIIKFIVGKLPTSIYKPLLDSFQGSFKDNFRLFAGLYFLYRWCFPLVQFNAEFSDYYTSIGGILVFILTLHTVCQPYVKRVHNIIDTLLFSDLILINFLLFFNYHKSRSQKPKIDAIVLSATVQLVLAYLPLVVMGIYVFTLLLRRAAKCMGCKIHTDIFKLTVPAAANKWGEQVMSIISRDKNPGLYEEEFVHDRDTNTYESTYNYFNDNN